LDSNVNGEWYTYLLLAYGDDPAARLPDSRARAAAEGWGGDGYVVHYHDADAATVLAAEWVWDTVADADEFALAFGDYANARFGADTAMSSVAGTECWQTASLTCLFHASDRTLWLSTPDEATLTAVLEQYPAFQP